MATQALCDAFKGVSMDRTNAIVILGQAMKFIEKYDALTGVQKRQLVLDQCKYMIQTNVSLNEAEKASLVMLVDSFAGHVIDLVVGAASLGLNLSKTSCCS